MLGPIWPVRRIGLARCRLGFKKPAICATGGRASRARKDGARETAKKLGALDNKVHPFALVRPAFAEALVRAVHAEAAFHEADLVQDPFVKSRVLQAIAEAHAERKQFKEAVRVVEMIDDDVSTARGDAPWRIAEVQGRVGDAESCLKTAHVKSSNPYGLWNCVKAQVDRGEVDSARHGVLSLEDVFKAGALLTL